MPDPTPLEQVDAIICIRFYHNQVDTFYQFIGQIHIRTNNKENNNRFANDVSDRDRRYSANDEDVDDNSNETTNYDEQSVYSASIRQSNTYGISSSSKPLANSSSFMQDPLRDTTKASIFQQQQLQRHHQHQFNQRGGNRNTSSESRSVTPSAASNKSRSPSLRSFKSDTLRSELTQSSFRSQHLYENKRAQSAGAASQMAKRYVY